MDNCSDLLQDYFSFIKGIVDSKDISLNISREVLQQDRQLKLIAKNVEKKITSALEDLLYDNKEDYEKFFDQFGMKLIYSNYSSYVMNKDTLKDLLLIYSSKEKEKVTLKE